MKKLLSFFVVALMLGLSTGVMFAQPGGGPGGFGGHGGGWRFGHHGHNPNDSTRNPSDSLHTPPGPPAARPNNPYGLSDSCYQVYLSMLPADTAAMLTADLAALAADRTQMDTLVAQARAARKADDTTALAAIRTQMQALGKQTQATWQNLSTINRAYRSVLSQVRQDCMGFADHHKGAPGNGGPTPSLMMTPIVPNPVSIGTPSASFTYTLATAPADVTVTVTDMLGNVVKTPFTGNVTATTAQTVQLDLSGLQPGMYIVRIQAGTAVASQKLMIR